MYSPIEFIEVFKEITENEVPGIYPNRYYASNFGKIFDTKLNRYITLSNRDDGYLSVSLNTNGKPKSYLLHRIIALLFVSGDHTLVVNHIDGNKHNPMFTNLEWISSADNNRHAVKTGLACVGEDSPKSVITESQAIKICEYLDKGTKSYSDIAKECNINSPDASSLISAIRRGESWKHISQNYNFAKTYKTVGRYKIKRNNL